ncbi:SAM-dependent methyltransferase [Richelia intracellularis HM01]|uniref:class I SAM-dependent methyltransferase n=1 Tax=Richelia intracellularis TaxID=1164990 RepID=UPI0002B5B755|nr:class I SAM-dependent methyltransferase [Richelia intracellularis]CCH65114.1 SAM-dependent methyltransferase [Richelia intracellularis HM01]
MSQSVNYIDQNSFFERDWSAYYDAVTGRPPRDTLLAALANFHSVNQYSSKTKFAVDLGCGNGRDTLELIRRGWWVLAIDGDKEGISRIRCNQNIDSHKLQTDVMRFESLVLPKSVDLINASFSLPFCQSLYFPRLWDTIVTSLSSGGRFCGQLFGIRDSWAINSSVNYHTREQIEDLLQSFIIEMLEEEEHLGKTALDEEKYWHIFHIVACKR